MEKLEIKDNVLHISDKEKYYKIKLNLIDIVATEGFNVEVKLNYGEQAIFHLDNQNSREEFEELCELLTAYTNFYRCDGNMVINLESLKEVTLNEEKNSWGYYDLNMQFKKMRGGLSSRNLEKLRETEANVKLAKQNYDEITNQTIGE